MKILVVSDSHGKNKYLDEVIKKVSPIDLCIHLGDLEGSEHFLEGVLDCPLEMIAGNNDYFLDLPKVKELMIGKYRVLMTHGHRQRVNFGVEDIKMWGRENGANIVLFGHTHLPFLEISPDITLLNPGSISLPRQDGHVPSFAVMELDSKGEAHFTINYVKTDFPKN